MRSVEVDRAKLAQRAGRDFLTVTELADTLVRREGLSFREAHRMVAAAVTASGSEDGASSVARMLKSQNPSLRMTDAELAQSLDPVNFIRVRKVIGGPAPERTAEAIERERGQQREIEEWLASKTALVYNK